MSEKCAEQLLRLRLSGTSPRRVFEAVRVLKGPGRVLKATVGDPRMSFPQPPFKNVAFP